MIFEDRHTTLILYPPELLPITNYRVLSPGESPPFFKLSDTELRKKRRILLVSYIIAERNADIYIRRVIDRKYPPDINTNLLKPYPEREPVRWPAKWSIDIRFFNSAAVDIAHRSTFGVWFLKPTLLERLLFESPLEDDERALIEKHEADKPFEQGILPILPSPDPSEDLRFALEREYQVKTTLVAVNEKTVKAGETEDLTTEIRPGVDEFLVLKEISANTTDAKIQIVRESVDAEPFELDAQAMSLDFSLPLWMHCFELFLLRAKNPTGADINVQVRYKWDVCRISDLVRSKILRQVVEPEFDERMKIGLW